MDFFHGKSVSLPVTVSVSLTQTRPLFVSDPFGEKQMLYKLINKEVFL